MGFVNNLCPINVTFGEVTQIVGNLRFISQSGALASSLFDWCKIANIGFSEFITLGNKAVINENDVLEYFQNNKPSPVGMYLESISNGSEFLRLTSLISKTNPVFILKPGKTKAAVKAMLSHTGAIAGEDAILDAVLKQVGVIRCQTLEDFFDLSRSLAWSNMPTGPRVAIISNAGGPAVISADAVSSEGLELAEFDSTTQTQLLQILPRSAGILNPVDVLGDALADRYTKASEIILQNNQVDSLVVILTPQIMTQIEQTARSLGELSKKYRKLIFCSFIGGGLVKEGAEILSELKIPHFRYPERAIWALSRMWNYKRQQSTIVNTDPIQIAPVLNINEIREITQKAIQNQDKTLNNLDANKIISLTGISTPTTQTVSDIESAKKFAEGCGYPVVLKLSSPGLIHKKAVGGIILDIRDDLQLESAWDKLITRGVDIQIQKEVSTGVEVIIGVKKDPTFGPVLLFGAGGSYTELICDRNLHLLPVDISQAKQLVEKSKIYSALTTYTLDRLYETIISLANLALSVPEISNIEINPVIVTPDGVWAVDCKVLF